MKNKALPGNLERMNKFKIMNITHIIKAFLEKIWVVVAFCHETESCKHSNSEHNFASMAADG